MSACHFKRRVAYRAEEYCLNRAGYIVEYTTPDDGTGMRQRVATWRCYWHRDEKFLPKGATQIVWSALSTIPAPDPAERSR